MIDRSKGFLVFEEYQENNVLNSQSSTKVQHSSLSGFVSVSQAAALLKRSNMTITRWCESGKIPAKPKKYGNRITYEISQAALALLLREMAADKLKAALPEQKPHSSFVKGWKQAMERGLMTGKVFSPLTVEYYVDFVEGFLASQSRLDAQSLKIELVKLSADQFAKRFKLYKALVSFGKYLIQSGQLEESFLLEVKPLYPKRHKPPVRKTLTEDQLLELLAVCKTPMERLIVLLLSQTGLRASEACSLKVEDIELEAGVLRVQLGKGGKRRVLGFGQALKEALIVYLSERTSGRLLVDQKGRSIARYGLAKRLEKLGKRANLSVSPHALRRAFVTINANKGRPLQMACGHSDIKTTMSYCRTQEQEVIKAMKDWD